MIGPYRNQEPLRLLRASRNRQRLHRSPRLAGLLHNISRKPRDVDTQAVPKAPRPVHEEAKHAKLHVEHAALVKRSERGIKIPRKVIDPTLPPRVKAVNPDVLERVTRETEQAREQAAVAGLSDLFFLLV